MGSLTILGGASGPARALVAAGAPALSYMIIMIASTPLMGGHYFVDLIAGAALTVAMTFVYGRSRAGTADLRPDS